MDFFLQKEGINRINRIVLRYNIGTQSDRKSKKWVLSLQNLPTIPKYGRTHPGHNTYCNILINQLYWESIGG